VGKKNQKETTCSSIDIKKLIDNSDMWFMLNLDKTGIHFHSSEVEDGIALVMAYLASHPSHWEEIKEYIDTRVVKR
jgi:hypothetical protein